MARGAFNLFPVGEPHQTLSGFVNNAEKGQCKTNAACPYPYEFAEYVAEFIAEPDVSCKRNQTE